MSESSTPPEQQTDTPLGVLRYAVDSILAEAHFFSRLIAFLADLRPGDSADLPGESTDALLLETADRLEQLRGALAGFAETLRTRTAPPEASPATSELPATPPSEEGRGPFLKKLRGALRSVAEDACFLDLIASHLGGNRPADAQSLLREAGIRGARLVVAVQEYTVELERIEATPEPSPAISELPAPELGCGLSAPMTKPISC